MSVRNTEASKLKRYGGKNKPPISQRESVPVLGFLSLANISATKVVGVLRPGAPAPHASAASIGLSPTPPAESSAAATSTNGVSADV